MTKRGSSFDVRVVIHIGGGLASEVFFFFFGDKGSVYEGCNEDFLYVFFSFSFRYIIFVHQSCDHLVIANLVLITYLYMYCFFFLFTHMILIYCMQSFISISH